MENIEETLDNAENEESNHGEELALTNGWSPLDEFKGDKSKWVDADTFNKRNEIKNTNNHQLKADLQAVKQQMADLTQKAAQSAAKEAKFHQEELKAERERLVAIKKESIAEGDGDKFTEAEEALEKLKKQERDVKETIRQAEAKPAPQVENAEYTSWVADNKWYLENKSLQLKANLIATDYLDSGYTPNRELFDKIKDDIVEMYGKKYPKELGVDLSLERGGPATSKGGGDAPKGGTTVNNLSAVYKQTMERMASEYPESQRANFIKSYLEAAGTNPEAWRK